MVYQAEQWQEAQEHFEALAAKNGSNVEYLGYLGVIAARLGDDEKARRIGQKLREIEEPYLYGLDSYWRARIAALLGDRSMGITLLQEALSQGWRYTPELPREMDFEPLRGYPPFEELIRPKG